MLQSGMAATLAAAIPGGCGALQGQVLDLDAAAAFRIPDDPVEAALAASTEAPRGATRCKEMHAWAL
jgi:hypothetical protein